MRFLSVSRLLHNWAVTVLLCSLLLNVAHAQFSDAQQQARLEQAAKANPQSFAAQHALGEFFVQRRQLVRAIPHLEKAQQLDPRHYANNYDLTLAYFLTGALQPARRQLAQMLLHDDKAELYHLLGEVEEKSGDTHAAAAAYHRAATLEPSEKYLLSLGNLLVRSSNYNEARTFFTYGLEKYPRSAQLKVGLGLTEYSQGQYEQAVRTLCAAVDLDPTDERPYLFLGEMYGVAPELADEITQRMAEFVTRHPKNANAHYFYAINRWRGRRDNASTVPLDEIEKSLLTAAQLDPKLTEAHYELGVLYAQQQRYSLAERALRKAIALRPEHPKAHYRLMQVYQRTGQKALALREQVIHQRLKDAEARTP
jgi:tetratricopeptide (TPR) repeat protein